jgi:hypothetical protein
MRKGLGERFAVVFSFAVVVRDTSLNGLKVDEPGSETSISASVRSSTFAGRLCFPLLCFMVVPFIVLAVALVNLTRARVGVDFVTVCPGSVLSRILSLIKTSGGGRRVLLLVGGRFWAIVLTGSFWCAGITRLLKRA